MPNAPVPAPSAPAVELYLPWLRNAIADLEITCRACERASSPAERDQYMTLLGEKRSAFQRLVMHKMALAVESARRPNRAD